MCCRKYASADFIPPSQEEKFDYVAVDGRSRMLCLKRALKLVKPEVRSLSIPGASLPDSATCRPASGQRADAQTFMLCREGLCS